jgi:hypothetical protein
MIGTEARHGIRHNISCSGEHREAETSAHARGLPEGFIGAHGACCEPGGQRGGSDRHVGARVVLPADGVGRASRGVLGNGARGGTNSKALGARAASRTRGLGTRGRRGLDADVGRDAMWRTWVPWSTSTTSLRDNTQ